MSMGFGIDSTFQVHYVIAILQTRTASIPSLIAKRFIIFGETFLVGS